MLRALQAKDIIFILADTKLSAMADKVNKENSPSLTKTESEVLDCVGRGLSQKEIATEMHVQRKTIDKHIDNIKKKFGISKATEMMAVYVTVKKSKKFDLELLRQYGLQIFLILITLCDGGIPHR